MTDDKILDTIKLLLLNPLLLIAVGLTGLLALFAPSWLGLGETLGFAWIPYAWRWVVGIVTVVALLASFLQLVSRAINIWKEAKQRQECLRYLDTLSDDEIIVLGLCVKENRRTAEIDKREPVGASLAHKKLMGLAPTQDNVWMQAYIIPAFVWKKLQEQKKQILSRTEEIVARREEKSRIEAEKARMASQRQNDEFYRRFGRRL